MSRVVATGVQDFEKLIANNRFYVDKNLSCDQSVLADEEKEGYKKLMADMPVRDAVAAL